jgi:hypothetical protein
MLTMASSITTFQTPSHHIACAYATSPSSLRCDLAAVARRPKRPRSCALDYGSAFGLTATGLRCATKAGHGFVLSRQRQKLF